MAIEFPEDELWLCPKFEKVELLNDPYLYKKGKNFALIVTRCDIAHTVDLKNDVKTYTNTTCSNLTTIEANVEDIILDYKLINQNFNVNHYAEEGNQEQFVTKRGASSLFKTMSMVEKFSVVENYIHFFKKKFFDLSTLTFLPELLAWKTIFNVDLKLVGHNFYGGSLINDSAYGYFEVIAVQSGEKNEIVWAIRTIQGIFGDVGGYSSVILGIVAWTLSGYQDFKYSMSFMKRLYFQKNTEEDEYDRRTDSEEMIESINNRKHFRFGYLRYLFIAFLENCFCCLNALLCRPQRKRWNEYKRFKTASEEMNKEIDLEYLIYQVRVLRMIMHGITKKRQRKAVKYFQRYLIQDGDTPKPQNLFDDDMAAEYLIENFDVVNDKIDRRILYELTGRKLDPEDYWDDSDQDQELDRFAEIDPNKVSDYA